MRIRIQTYKIPSIYFLLMVMCLMAGSVAFGQGKEVRKGDEFFREQAWDKAIRQYRNALKSADDPYVRSQLAQCFTQTNEIDAAKTQYNILMSMEKASPEDYLRFAQLLKDNGEFDEAEQMVKAYELAGGVMGNADFLKNEAAPAQSAAVVPDASTVIPLSINTEYSEMGAMVYGGDVIFASNRPRGFLSRNFNEGNGQNFFDLYRVNLPSPSAEAIPVLLPGQVNTVYNDGPATASPDGKYLYFTRNGDPWHGTKRANDGMMKLDLIKAEQSQGKWKEIENIYWNNTEFSCGHPTISPDGTEMFFVSDAEGGEGGTDIWVSEWQGLGWGTPEPLGDAVNTPKNEMFPYFHPEGTLFFASDGYGGLGGLDIFYVQRTNEGWGQIKTMSEPLNSSSDDFGVHFMPNLPSGYFSSDRPGGRGGDDIYYFYRKIPVSIKVMDSRTQQNIMGAKVSIQDQKGHISQVDADKNGVFFWKGDWGKDLKIKVEAFGYTSIEETIKGKTLPLAGDQEMEIDLATGQIYANGNLKTKGVVMPSGDNSALTKISSPAPSATPDGQVNMSGKVADASGTGLGNTEIYITGKAEDKIIITGPDGTFNADFSKDLNDPMVIIVKQGYQPYVGRLSQLMEGPGGPQGITLKNGTGIVLESTVRDQGSGSPLDGVILRAMDPETGEVLHTYNSDPNGRGFAVIKPTDGNLIMILSREGYLTQRFELGMDPSQVEGYLKPRFSLAKATQGALVQTIYYGYNSAEVTNFTQNQLMEVVFFLKDNPRVSVELGTHTDSRGNADYNLILSQRRAREAIDFIIGKGIAPNRISAKGYGESMISNRCIDGVACEESEHSQNRRAEIKVTRLK